jgi:hypothetical protein
VGRAALELELGGPHGARWYAVVEAMTGRLLALESLVRHELLSGTATGDIVPLYAMDPLVSRAFPWLLLQLDAQPGASAYTDGGGRYQILAAPGTWMLRSLLQGLFVQVEQQAEPIPSPGFARPVDVPGTSPVHFGPAEARDDERTIYLHTNVIHDYARSRFGFVLLDFPLPAVAAVRNPQNGSPDYANAFWDGQRMGFGNGAGSFQNFGLFADVIYHEYTHAITDHMYRPGGGLQGAIGGAIHEALSDYFACTLTDEPLVGEYLSGGPDYLRNLDNALIWPDDRDPGDEEHANGEILGGALWHVRERLGAAVADRVIHFARQLYPRDFEAYLEAILLQDDLLYGDAAPGNGSPHREDILAAFALHGMGPLASREIRIRHVPLGDTEESDAPRTVYANVGTLLPGVVDQMRLFHATLGAFESQAMTPDGRGGYVGTIPAQPQGTAVRYYLSAVRRRPFEEHRLPENAPESTFAYVVGPDHEPPGIAHAARSQLPAFAWPAELVARIEDNLGVAYAWVEYTQDGVRGPQLGLVASADDPGLYSTRFLPAGGRVGEVVEYWFTAVDASRAGNRSRLPQAGGFRIELVEDLQEDFEQDRSSWLHRPVVVAHADPWHLTGAENHTSGGGRAWLCGLEAGEYPPGTAAELVSDWYRIGSGAIARLWSRMDAEENGPVFAFDGGIVQIRTQSDPEWVLLHPTSGYTHTMSETGGTNVLEPGTPCFSGRNPGWRALEFLLEPWAGERMRLRFLFGADGVPSGSGLRGWLLDDFALEPGVRDPTDAPGLPARASRLLVGAPSPNPFNPQVAFELAVPDGAGRVRLDILDARGRLVRRLLDGVLPAGRSRAVWAGNDRKGVSAASGVYIYRLDSALGTEKGKLVLLR